MNIEPDTVVSSWHLARNGDEQDAANWAYDHVDELLAEIERLRDGLALVAQYPQPSSSEMRRIARDALGNAKDG